ILASNGCTETIYHFLKVVHAASPSVNPTYFMSDFDGAQIQACHLAAADWAKLNAAKIAVILLCWWHCLHSWQQRFVISKYPEVWELLKKWIRMDVQSEFDAAWAKIQRIAPKDFVEYLRTYWMKPEVVAMWSAVHRRSRSIFEMCDTNMLVEAYHHVLKSKFLEAKRNRRLDHLLYVLVNKVSPYYESKQQRQEFGFEGEDCEVRKRKDIKKRAQDYTLADIERDGEDTFRVRSRSCPSKAYDVDVDAYHCTCIDFPLISYCKHLSAVQRLFPEKRDATAPTTPSLPTTLDLPPQDNEDLPPTLDVASVLQKGPARNPAIVLAERMEVLAARLRKCRRKELESLPALQEALDAMYLETDSSGVMPSAGYVAPNVSSGWKETEKAIVPGVKTKKRKVGDPAYGAGSSSGLKAKK
ncbi:hypothetical protein FB45DRAFT_702941, partial [Roridomyces roridus]